MNSVKRNHGTSFEAVETLIRSVEETLQSLRPCPRKSRLERIYFGLDRELEALEQAIRNCNEIDEHRALYKITSKIARFYRIHGNDGQG